MSEDTDIQMRRLFAETAQEPADADFVTAVESKVGRARKARQFKNWLMVGLGLTAAASLAPSVAFMAERLTAAATSRADWSAVMTSLGTLPTVQVAGMALAAAACAFAFVRVQD